MKVSKSNLIIYIVFLITSLLLIGLYFIEPSNAWCILSCSIGASGIGAVLLGFFIERANNIQKERTLLVDRKTTLFPIVLVLRHSICNFIAYFDAIAKKIESKNIKEFLIEFNDLLKAEAMGESSIFRKVNQQEYIVKAKQFFFVSPLARDAIKEINNNRSSCIMNKLLNSEEIKDLYLVEMLINGLQSCSSMEGINMQLIKIFSYISLPELRDVVIVRDNNNFLFLYHGDDLHITPNF